MRSLSSGNNFKTRADILTFFSRAIEYRENHKKESGKIAQFVFDTTHKSRLGELFDDDIEFLRNEFGALEAPGLPPDKMTGDEYVDCLWGRLEVMVEKHQK